MTLHTGNDIRRARKAAGMTQVALATTLGVSRQTVSGWEAGRYRPQRRLMERVAMALGPLSLSTATEALGLFLGLETTSATTRTLTWIELAREELGSGYSDADLDAILWEHTGFPHFWPDRDKTPQENCRQQLREFMAAHPATK